MAGGVLLVAAIGIGWSTVQEGKARRSQAGKALQRGDGVRGGRPGRCRSRLRGGRRDPRRHSRRIMGARGSRGGHSTLEGKFAEASATAYESRTRGKRRRARFSGLRSKVVVVLTRSRVILRRGARTARGSTRAVGASLRAHRGIPPGAHSPGPGQARRGEVGVRRRACRPERLRSTSSLPFTQGSDRSAARRTRPEHSPEPLDSEPAAPPKSSCGA